MHYLIVTDDENMANKAREMGAAVFTSNQPTEQVAPITVENADNSSKAYTLLCKLGVKPNVKGYYYLKFLMEKCETIPGYNLLSITKEIYPECANEFHTTPQGVEKAIRQAIYKSFESAPEMYSTIFGGSFTKAPANSEFIGMISEYFANNK